MRMIIETIGEFDGVGAIGVIATRPDGGNGTSVSVTIAGKSFPLDAVKQIAERLSLAADRALALAKEVEAMSNPELTRKIVQFEDWHREQRATLEKRVIALDALEVSLAEREAKLPPDRGEEVGAEADPAAIDPDAIRVK